MDIPWLPVPVPIKLAGFVPIQVPLGVRTRGLNSAQLRHYCDGYGDGRWSLNCCPKLQTLLDVFFSPVQDGY